MMTSFKEDTQAEYEEHGKAPVSIDVIFNPDIFAIDPEYREDEIIPPVAVIKTEDAPNIKQKEKLTVLGVRYEVLKPVPDGAGLTTVYMREL